MILLFSLKVFLTRSVRDRLLSSMSYHFYSPREFRNIWLVNPLIFKEMLIHTRSVLWLISRSRLANNRCCASICSIATLFFRSETRKRSKSNVSNNNFSFKSNSTCSLTSKSGQRFTCSNRNRSEKSHFNDPGLEILIKWRWQIQVIQNKHFHCLPIYLLGIFDRQ